jgi:hypothetical protein
MSKYQRVTQQQLSTTEDCRLWFSSFLKSNYIIQYGWRDCDRVRTLIILIIWVLDCKQTWEVKILTSTWKVNNNIQFTPTCKSILCISSRNHRRNLSNNLAWREAKLQRRECDELNSPRADTETCNEQRNFTLECKYMSTTLQCKQWRNMIFKTGVNYLWEKNFKPVKRFDIDMTISDINMKFHILWHP